MMFYQVSADTINNAVLIDKKQAKYRFFVCYSLLFSLKFVETIFVSSIILSHVIAETSIILAKHFPFSHLYVLGFHHRSELHFFVRFTLTFA